MFLSNPFSGAFGLDIGDLSIKLIQLRRQGWRKKSRHFELKEFRSVNLPPGAILNGEIQQPEVVRNKLLFILGKDGGRFKQLRVPWVVASLPEPKTFLKLIEVEAEEGELTDDDVAYHARRHLPFDLDEAYIHWQVVNQTASRKSTQVLIGAVPKIISDSYTYLLESVGLTPIALEIEAMAVARSLITDRKNYAGEARAILDLGATRSGLVIYDNNSIQFSTNLKFSGEIATTAIMQGLQMDHNEAENLKIKNGVSYDPNHPRYLKIVTDMSGSLLNEIKTTFNFYKEHFENANPVTHITMGGGAANWMKLDSLISQKLRISAKPGHPWKNTFNRRLQSNQDPKKSLGLSAAIGLALRAVQNPLEISD